DFPGPRCFEAAFEFLDRNRSAEGWFLQIECFDPHEPFHAPERFKRQFETGYNGGVLDWPHYEKVAESPQEIAEIRRTTPRWSPCATPISGGSWTTSMSTISGGIPRSS
ncbi:MAG TPA: hypothetical protein VFZ10_23670, partial [Geminicoccaceae bacterium]